MDSPTENDSLSRQKSLRIFRKAILSPVSRKIKTTNFSLVVFSTPWAESKKAKPFGLTFLYP